VRPALARRQRHATPLARQILAIKEVAGHLSVERESFVGRYAVADARRARPGALMSAPQAAVRERLTRSLRLSGRIGCRRTPGESPAR
jgi:hypothetical protein